MRESATSSSTMRRVDETRQIHAFVPGMKFSYKNTERHFLVEKVLCDLLKMISNSFIVLIQFIPLASLRLCDTK
jgi:hypothetical protein